MNQLPFNLSTIVNYLNTNTGIPYSRINCKSKWVSECITIPEIQSSPLQMKYNTPPSILINAPTGSGKSTFVFEQLAADAKQQNYKILLLTNRTVLTIQQQKIITEQLNIPSPTFGPTSSNSYYDNIFISTYQSILYNLQELDRFLGGYCPKYIIFDEAHFFCADAIFNSNTDLILTTLARRYASSMRIYMSATPEVVKPMISVYERIFLKNRNTVNEIKEYFIQPNFSGIALHFFHDWNFIYKKISEDENRQKWLIFVSSKEEGRTLHQKIGSPKSNYIDSTLKNNSSIVKDLTIGEKFSSKVLISTSVLDNGINIKDDELTNIVIDFFDPIQFMQMLGRKRRSPGEHIDLYVRVPESKLLQNYIDRSQRQLNIINYISQNPVNWLQTNWGTLSPDEQKLVRLSCCPPIMNNASVIGVDTFVSMEVNPFAWYQLSRLSDWYQKLQVNMRLHENYYEREMCSWLGVQYDSKMNIEDEDISSSEEQDDVLIKALNGIFTQPLKNQNEIVLTAEESKQLLSDVISISKKYGYNKTKLNIKEENENRRLNANLQHVIEFFDLPYSFSGSSKDDYVLAHDKKIES